MSLSPSSPPLRIEVPVAETQGALALAVLPRQDPPSARRVAPDHDRPAAAVVPIDIRVRRSVEEWTRRFAQAAVEIVGGDRPASQLLRWTSSQVYGDLRRRAHLVALAGDHQPGLQRVQQVRPKVHSVHTCFLSNEIVECGIHVRYGQRGRAIAARFELRDQRWLCTALDFS